MNPDHVAIDETVIQIDSQRYRLYAAIDPATKEYLHVMLFPIRTQALSERFLVNLREKHDVEYALFLVDGRRGSTPQSTATGSDFSTRHRGIEMPQNASSKN